MWWIIALNAKGQGVNWGTALPNAPTVMVRLPLLWFGGVIDWIVKVLEWKALQPDRL